MNRWIPQRWNFPCPHDECPYYIDVAVDSGTGEEAARLMDAHVQRAHGERFPLRREELGQ